MHFKTATICKFSYAKLNKSSFIYKQLKVIIYLNILRNFILAILNCIVKIFRPKLKTNNNI